MRVNLLMLVVLAICASHVQARIYICVDKDGNTVYSDTPHTEACLNAEEVKLNSLPDLVGTKPVMVPNNTLRNNSSEQEANGVYKSLAITSPSTDENLRNNEGNVQIAFQASPALKARSGHQYVIIFGGKEVYKGTQSSVTLENVDRGTHAVSAKVIARNGRTLISSEPVKFTLHRFSVLQGNAPSNGSGSGSLSSP